MTTSGALLEYVLDLRPQSNEGTTSGGRASDQETGIEVTAHHVAEWLLLMPNAIAGSTSSSGAPNQSHGTVKTGLNQSVVKRMNSGRQLNNESGAKHSGYWMSQVEMMTYAPPYRRFVTLFVCLFVCLKMRPISSIQMSCL